MLYYVIINVDSIVGCLIGFWMDVAFILLLFCVLNDIFVVGVFVLVLHMQALHS